MHLPQARPLVTLGVAAALVLVGITTAAAGSTERSGKKGVAFARAQIAHARKVPGFKAPGPAFDASKAKGKVIFNIPVASYLPFVVNVGKAMQKLGKQLGVQVIDYPNQGQPAQWAQGMQQAIARHVDLIVLNTGADPKLLAPQVAQARKAGIPVLVVHQYTETDPIAKGVSLSVPAPFVRVAKLLAYTAIAATNGKTNLLVLGDNQYESNRDMLKVMRATLAAHCPGCKLQFLNEPVADWGTKIQGSVQTALLRDKSINFIVPIFDAMQQWTIPGIMAAGAVGRVQTASYNGDPAVIKRIQQANVVRATVGESANELAYAYLDEAMRLMTGAPVIKNLQTPVRLFDGTNAKQAGTPPKWNTGYGNAFVKGYKKLWMMGK